MSSGILASFMGALTASLSVLLTISYGVVASRFNLLKESSARDISKTCVRLFLPALLITNVGSELHHDTAYRYAPILIWALTYALLSMGLGWILNRAFRFPAWTIPALCFNNTTALPLLLIQSLETSGILASLAMSDSDSSSAVVSRAKSYFLISSFVGNSLTFAVGPKLLDNEEAPDKKGEIDDSSTVGDDHPEGDEEHAQPTNSSGRTAEEQEEHENDTTTLLPKRIAKRRDRARFRGERYWGTLPGWLRSELKTLGGFMNAPMIGAIVGAVLGLAPPLHTAFFNEPQAGGIFKAWLTLSLKNVGELFAALQLVVVGAKLSMSLMKIKKGEDSGPLPVIPVVTVLGIRFIVWPVVSIGVIFLLASKTSLLNDDPVLWFVLMLLPTGPPATKLTALADVSGVGEEEKMSISKFIAISYAISPVICFAVVGSLKAALAVK